MEKPIFVSNFAPFEPSVFIVVPGGALFRSTVTFTSWGF